MEKTITIDGNKIHDIASFYKEINQVFMSEEDWELGPSLDALNDLFYGGFGAIKGTENIKLIWQNISKNRVDLGTEITLSYYRDKLNSPSTFNIKWVNEKIEALEKGEGQTYFEVIMEIIAEHPNIKLIKDQE
ncbi:barstar family protein [Pedobacter sp. AW31-3R]|uniref:barstar family protein n=1 Tax=Pedobacter sp. AW31-3R TaxID=3445781 RepID=UPI003FA05475